jgi:hypothetical protein
LTATQNPENPQPWGEDLLSQRRKIEIVSKSKFLPRKPLIFPKTAKEIFGKT